MLDLIKKHGFFLDVIRGFLCAVLLFFVSFPVRGQSDEVDRVRPTLLVAADGGLSTYKSQMVASNDTGTSFDYTVGFHAGQSRNLGILIKTDSNTTTFKYTTSSIQTGWQDTIVRYYLGWFYLGGILSSVDLKAKENGEKYIDVVGSGYGANAGFIIPITKVGAVFMDYSDVTISSARELDKVSVKFGARSDEDIGAIFNVTKKMLDFVVGYKQRTLPIKVASSYDEVITTTYLGMRLGFNF